jgi:hypothetical protein
VLPALVVALDEPAERGSVNRWMIAFAFVLDRRDLYRVIQASDRAPLP